MNIKFNYLEFKNILSFGNKICRINFEHGLHLITGENGTGKSTSMLDTLSFCLFGAPYRKIKIEELVNRKTKKNLEVTCNFNVNDVNYIITRGLKPNKLIIFEDGVEINLLSSKKLNNEEIESKIGINHKLFKQIISLSINHNEPFLDSTATKKREITDELFNISILTKIDKNIKEDSKDLKLQLSINDNTIQHLTHNISNIQLRLSEAQTISKQFEANKNKDILHIENEILEKTANKNKIKERGKLLEQEVQSLESSNELEISKQLDIIKSDISNLNFKISQNNKSINFLKSNDICPTCKIPIDNTHKNDELNNLKAENLECQNSIALKTPQVESLTLELSNQRKISNSILLKKREIDAISDEYKSTINEIKKLQQRLVEISNRTFDVNIEKIANELRDKESQLSDFKNNSYILNSKICINQKLNEHVMDTGFKSYIYDQLIPILNYYINDYLKLFELPVNISFTNSMDVNIKTLTDNTNDVNYYCFSEGEKKRIDFAILLSFINVTKKLTNWNCNLLIIDELLDSSIDDAGLDKLLCSIQNIIKSSNDMSVYIISHKIKKEYINQFSSLIELELNKNNYSEIKLTQQPNEH